MIGLYKDPEGEKILQNLNKGQDSILDKLSKGNLYKGDGEIEILRNRVAELETEIVGIKVCKPYCVKYLFQIRI